MRKLLLVLTLTSLPILSFCQINDNTKTIIDNYLKEAAEINEIPGLAVAVVKKGKTVYEKYYGKSSFEENGPIDKKSIFRLYSTTKLISTVGLFQLVEKGQLSLEDNISKYLDGLPKEWQQVKVKNLITHSSGLPDVVKFEDIPYSLAEHEKWVRLYQKPIVFEAGDHYDYNQTNYLLVTKIIEKISGLTFEDYIIKNQFSSVAGGVIFAANDSEFIRNRVAHYRFSHKGKKYEKVTVLADHGKIHNSGSGLNITLSEFVAWNKRLDDNALLKPATKSLMWSQFQFKSKEDKFLYGWGIYGEKRRESFGFSGGYMTAFRKFVKNDLTIIFLSNGYKHYNVEEQVIDHIAGVVNKQLVDNGLLAYEEITADFYQNDFGKAAQNFNSIKKQNPTRNFENRLLAIGYNLMNNENSIEAIKVFELNARENQKSANAYDCLAEAYFANKQLEVAKQNYKKSLELYPGNTNATDMINKIDEMLKQK